MKKRRIGFLTAIIAVFVIVNSAMAVLLVKGLDVQDVLARFTDETTTTAIETTAPQTVTAETTSDKTTATQTTAENTTTENTTADNTTAAGTTTEPLPAEDTLTISFIGDCMFATNHGGFGKGSFNLMASQKEPEYFLKNFSEMFFADDFTIANCEGVLSDSNLTEKVQTTEIAFWFKGPTSNAKIFKVSGVDLASVVNNHSHDFGQQGSDDTEKALEAVGVIPGKRNKVSYVTVKQQKIGIFCCSLYGSGYLQDILVKVEEMKAAECDLIIIYYHGGVESVTVPEQWKIDACHALVDAGADIVVGSHPHVLQPMEIYNGKPIVYSLANFCFGGNSRPPRNTIVYQAVFDLRNGEVVSRKDNIIPCTVYSGEINNYQPSIITDEVKKKEILNFMNSYS